VALKVDIDPDDAKTLQADSRGRVNLGMDHADEEVKVVVLDE
jgi:hypothetical protein